MYESPSLLAQYLLFHYGRDDELLPWPDGPRAALHFPQRCVSEGLDIDRLGPADRALDIGCAVGGSTFELARHCGEAVGIDYSASFIRAASRLRDEGELGYEYPETGEVTKRAVAAVDPQIERSRARFEVGDAHELRGDLGQFDAVICCNLLCRLHTPRRLLARLPDLVKPGGQLFFTTPETWLEDYTPRAEWLGGRKDRPPLMDALREALEPAFAVEAEWEMPFLIREHRRKFQWSVAHASRWVRRA